MPVPPMPLSFTVERAAFPGSWELRCFRDGVEVAGGMFFDKPGALDSGQNSAAEQGRDWLESQMGLL